MTIKELRQMKGMTLAAFAHSIGIGMSTLTGYEAGKREPGAKALAAIREVYGVDLNSDSAPANAAPAEKKAAKSRAKKGAVTPAEEKSVSIIIQSAMGGEITPEEILSRVGDVDKVYVRPDQNAIYWVKAKETGAISIW